MPSPSSPIAPADVVVSTNATDTIIHLPRFPSPDLKVETLSVEPNAEHQVTGAAVACSHWGLRTCYIGKIGDDLGEFQKPEMLQEHNAANWLVARSCSSQMAFILVDQASRERAALWKSDPVVAIHPGD
ncbi:MAG TPA: hypothetical protein VG322_16410 [Candidatus Acidoferrales bacterium]|jgi:sulfofructose kinase|nr:hypothetical protein [Candidatus Acidoferrales bacterium]